MNLASLMKHALIGRIVLITFFLGSFAVGSVYIFAING